MNPADTRLVEKIENGDVLFIDTDAPTFAPWWECYISQEWRDYFPLDKPAPLDLRHAKKLKPASVVHIVDDVGIWAHEICHMIILVRILQQLTPKHKRLNTLQYERALRDVFSTVSGRLHVEIMNLVIDIVVVGKTPEHTAGGTCAICTLSLDTQREVGLRITGHRCKHRFHVSCILHLRSPACPLCRRLLLCPNAVIIK